jgi:hypothetical protein
VRHCSSLREVHRFVAHFAVDVRSNPLLLVSSGTSSSFDFACNTVQLSSMLPPATPPVNFEPMEGHLPTLAELQKTYGECISDRIVQLLCFCFSEIV